MEDWKGERLEGWKNRNMCKKGLNYLRGIANALHSRL